MLLTQFVTDTSDAAVGLFAVMVMLKIHIVSGTEYKMIMNVSFVNMGGENVRIFPFQNLTSQFFSDGMSFFVRHFSWLECLDNMEGFILSVLPVYKTLLCGVV